MQCMPLNPVIHFFLTIPHDEGNGGESLGKKGMSKSSASRIQSHSAKSGRNQGFARRAQSAADRRGSKKQ
jgi:hypothetical protein